MVYETERKNLIESLKEKGYLSSPQVIEAMLKVERHNFVPENLKDEAYLDTPLPIGQGQTISAPHMVAIMTEALDIKPDHKILEIGTGSGYQATVLAEIAKKGKVYTVERIPELAEQAKKNLAGYKNVEVIIANGTLGYQKESPYDRIVVTAGAQEIPQALIDQLKDGGKMLIPVGGRFFQDLILVEKKKGKIAKKNLGGCMFVPLVES